MEDMIRN